MFNFERLIKKYSHIKPMLKVKTGGYRDYDNGGVWVEGNVGWKELEGAVLPLGKKLIFDNSAYTTEDRKLYTYEDVQENETIKFKGREYTTMDCDDYEEYDPGLNIFILKAGGKDD